MFGTIFMNQDNMSFDLCVQDLDQTETSAQLVKTLELNGKFKITRSTPPSTPRSTPGTTRLNLVLVIPKGYERSLMQRMALQRPQRIRYHHVHLRPQLYFGGHEDGNPEPVFAGMNQGMSGKPPFIRSAEKSILTRKYRFIEFFIPGIIAMAVMTSSLFGTVNVNTELRQKGIIRKLSTTPITRTDWILSNILYQFILAVISTIAMLLVSYAVFDVSLQINAWLPVFIVLDVFAFVGIGMILTRFVQGGAERRRRGKRHQFPDDVPLGELLPHRDDAGLPAEVRQDTASVLRERGAPGIHGI